MRRMTMALLAALLLTMFGVGTASADPINSKNAEVFEIECDGETLTIVTTHGLPAHVVGDTRNFIPVQFTFTGTFTDPETGEEGMFTETFSIGKGKRTGQQDDLTTCMAALVVEDPDVGPVSVEITVLGFFTPRGR